MAVADIPIGPFKDARGSAIITNDMTKQTQISWDDIDPSVFIDHDGQAYLFWGNRILFITTAEFQLTAEVSGDQFASIT